LPADYTFTNTDKGLHTFILGAILKTAGPQSVAGTDTMTAHITGLANVSVRPAPASVLLITAPSSVTPGVAFNFTLTAVDAYGNVATGYTGSVHFSSSDPAGSLPVNYKFTSSDAGMVTLAAILDTIGSQSLTATDTLNSGLTGTDGTIQVV
jgi:hypothetical protein